MTDIGRILAAAAALSLLAAPAHAQRLNTGSGGTYGQVTLRSGYEPDPYQVTVLGGGAIDISTVNENCTGFVSAGPSFSLRYRSGELPLFIGATSDADTTIAVRAPNGEWACNDDSDGLNPVVSWEQPSSGRYQIWVGRFGAANENALAMLHISEVGPPGGLEAVVPVEMPDPSLDPNYGVLDLVQGFRPDPRTVGIAAGGEMDVSAAGASGCVGWVSRAPDYRVNWTGGANRALNFSVASEVDTTLVINDAEGNWVCNDDSDGLNPAVSFQNAPSGQYDVWVGTFSEGDLSDSILSISSR